jgi:enediyne biosynthesis thioesterase
MRSAVARGLQLAADAIAPEDRPLEDLHLNSIAVGQLVAEAARSLGLAPPPAPTGLRPLAAGRVWPVPADTQRRRETAPPAYAYRHIVGFRETNLVGNVYFVNHLEWQGRCREMFLREKAPSVIDDLAHGLALVTTRCSCECVAELNAFDEVRVDMRLRSIADTRLDLGFEYWLCRKDGEELVAVGEQCIACFRSIDGVPAPLPPALTEALRPYSAQVVQPSEP